MVGVRACSRIIVLAALSLVHARVIAAQPAPLARISPASEYTGLADASGSVACGTDFFIVCDDETSFLRVYRRNGGGGPVAEIDLGNVKELRVPGAKKELDLEAAAPLGDKVFWIGSHGNNKEGTISPNRRQLFATKVSADGGKFRVVLEGQPYRRLIEDLIATPALRELKLEDAAAEGRAPKDDGGFNIEGMAASTEGHLWLGFRNPIPQGRALIVPVTNPEEIIRGARAKIGNPIRLDLGGRGIRDLVRADNDYFILAGDSGESDRRGLITQLYRWRGVGASPQLVAEFPKFNAESIIVYPDTAGRELQVLSDDGQKPPPPVARRKFRSVKVQL